MFCEVFVFECFVRFKACEGRVVCQDIVGSMEVEVHGLWFHNLNIGFMTKCEV